jgi:hypothetical protein
MESPYNGAGGSSLGQALRTGYRTRLGGGEVQAVLLQRILKLGERPRADARQRRQLAPAELRQLFK